MRKLIYRSRIWAGIAWAFPAFFFASFAIAGELEFSELAQDPQWLALLHFSGAHSSAGVSSKFFLSPEGARDPRAELEATVSAFRLDPTESRCRFPARAMFLAERLNFSFPEKNCERFEKWKAAIAPRGLELVFAAAFINSPSSMYGHTLLKFPRSGKTEGNELLDYTLNYGAETGNIVGMPYVWKGLTGGFSGYFATAPFYLKVKEYNFVENRDFWIYPILLTPSELERVVAHAWELREIPFDYYFLQKNCAYFLLEFLEVAWPGKRLAQKFNSWTVPLDTIRALEKEGKLGTAKYRPSRYRLLVAARERLPSSARAAVSDFVLHGEGNLTQFSTEQLDAAYELLRYREEKNGVLSTRAADLLTERSRRPEPAPSYDFSSAQPPHLGHRTGRLGVAAGASSKRNFAELSYRGTLHDQGSDPQGYEENSELTMGDLRIRVDNKIYLERFEGLRLRSLAPREEWVSKRAWSFSVGLEDFKSNLCEAWHCLLGQIHGGMGMAQKIGPLLAYGLGELRAEVGPPLQRSFRFSAGPQLGLHTQNLFSKVRFGLEGEHAWAFWGDRAKRSVLRTELVMDLRHNQELRLRGEWHKPGYREGQVAAFWYF